MMVSPLIAKLINCHLSDNIQSAQGTLALQLNLHTAFVHNNFVHNAVYLMYAKCG